MTANTTIELQFDHTTSALILALRALYFRAVFHITSPDSQRPVNK